MPETLTAAKTWNESQHPRAENGQFGECASTGKGAQRKTRLEVTDSYGGQLYGHVTAEVDGQAAGRLDWESYEGRATIAFVEVAPRFQRQGIALELVNELQKQLGDKAKGIDWGTTTESGHKLQNAWFASQGLKPDTDGIANAGKENGKPAADIKQALDDTEFDFDSTDDAIRHHAKEAQKMGYSYVRFMEQDENDSSESVEVTRSIDDILKSTKAMPNALEELIEELTDCIKRFDPTQTRGDDGRWTAGASVGRGAKANRKLRAGTIREAKEKHGVSIPKDSTDVKISDDVNADVVATYTPKGGKKENVPFYHADYTARQKKVKFDRVAQLHKDLPGIDARLSSDIAEGGKDHDTAMALRLISKTGLRNGGEGGGGKVAAYGATSLLASHATVKGDKVILDFPGKDGVRNRHAVVDPILARHIEAKKAEGETSLFDTNDSRARDYMSKISDGKYKVHDMRTMYASALAADRVSKMPAPKDAAEAEQMRKRVGYVVSQHLGHEAYNREQASAKIDADAAKRKITLTPEKRNAAIASEVTASRARATKMSLTNYIHPDVFKAHDAFKSLDAEIKFAVSQPRDDEGKWTVISGHRVSISGKKIRKGQIDNAAVAFGLNADVHRALHHEYAKSQDGIQNSPDAKLLTDDHLYRTIAHAQHLAHVRGEQISGAHIREALEVHGKGGTHEGRRFAPLTPEQLAAPHHPSHALTQDEFLGVSTIHKGAHTTLVEAPDGAKVLLNNDEMVLGNAQEAKKDAHRVIVEKALKDGKNVPEHVLKDYRDLKQKYHGPPSADADLGPFKNIMPDETLIAFGDAIKAVEETPDSYKFGAYLVVFDSPDVSRHRDHFTKSTDYGFVDGETRPLMYNHGLDGTIGKTTIGRATLFIKDDGIWMDGEIKKRRGYLEKHIDRIGHGLTQRTNIKGHELPVFGTSSGATAHSVIRERSGDGHEIKQWHIGEASITPTPAEPLTGCGAIKSLGEFGDDVTAIIFGDELKMDGPFKFASTQIHLPSTLGEHLMTWGKENIPDEALAADGRENEPHVTVLYGLENDERETIQELVTGFGPIQLALGETAFFEAPDYDVVYCKVNSSDLFRLRGRLETLPHTSTHATYTPHATIAYVKSGMGKLFTGRYIDFPMDAVIPLPSMGNGFSVDVFYVSGKDGGLRPISTCDKAIKSGRVVSSDNHAHLSELVAKAKGALGDLEVWLKEHDDDEGEFDLRKLNRGFLPAYPANVSLGDAGEGADTKREEADLDEELLNIRLELARLT